jgi:hypothetical protein
VGCVDPVVGATAHDMVAVDIALVDRNLARVSASSQSGEALRASSSSQAVGPTHIAVCCRVNLAIGRGGHLNHSMSRASVSGERVK